MQHFSFCVCEIAKASRDMWTLIVRSSFWPYCGVWVNLSLQVSFSPGTQVNTLLCSLYRGRGGLECPVKFIITLDAYGEHVQIHEEEMANGFFFYLKKFQGCC